MHNRKFFNAVLSGMVSKPRLGQAILRSLLNGMAAYGNSLQGVRPWGLLALKLAEVNGKGEGVSGKKSGGLFLNGWGTRIRTWVNGARTRRPAARRSPSAVQPCLLQNKFS